MLLRSLSFQCLNPLSNTVKAKSDNDFYSSSVSIKEQYKDTLDEYSIPEWYRDAKFGIFIHYGVYAVPAYGDEWYPKWMYVPGGTTWGGTPIYEYNKKTYGSVSLGEGYGYKQFIGAFSDGIRSFANTNQAQVWADLFKDAGAKYVIDRKSVV